MSNEEEFAKKHNIRIVRVEGEMGSGYACEYIYYDPESVMRAWNKEKSLGENNE